MTDQDMPDTETGATPAEPPSTTQQGREGASGAFGALRGAVGQAAAGASAAVRRLTGDQTAEAVDTGRQVVTGPRHGKPPSAGVKADEKVRRQLRERGQELMQRARTLEPPEGHPALRMLLDQMSPDEARIVRFLALNNAQPFVDVRLHNAVDHRENKEMLRHLTFLGREAGCLAPGLAGVYIDSLARLGAVHIAYYRVHDRGQYDTLLAQPEFRELPALEGFWAKMRVIRYKVVYGGVTLSALGRELYDLCLCPQGDKLSEWRSYLR